MSFEPLKILEKPFSVMLLNHNGDIGNTKSLCEIWNKATTRLTVDGGTNLWYELYKLDSSLKLPNFVTGDFDSILPNVLTFVQNESLRCPSLQVIPTPDQNETDFCKAFYVLQNEGKTPRTVIAIASNRVGRFDQMMANINTLIKSVATEEGKARECQLYLYDHHNLIFPMPPSSLSSTLSTSHSHSIKELTKTIEILLKSGLVCGIIPICGKTQLKTEGLKWNLDGSYRFGQIISTSNETINNVIHIQTDKPVIFSVAYSLLPEHDV